MKYYQIGMTAEPKVMGVTNGIHQIEINKKAMHQNDVFKEFLNFFSTHNTEFWKKQEEIRNIKIPPAAARILSCGK